MKRAPAAGADAAFACDRCAYPKVCPAFHVKHQARAAVGWTRIFTVPSFVLTAPRREDAGLHPEAERVSRETPRVLTEIRLS